MSISRGLRGELGAVRVERSSCAPLGKLRWLARGVEGVELMLMGVYTVDCSYVCVASMANVGLSRQVGWQEQRLEGWGRRSPLTDAYVRMVTRTSTLRCWDAGMRGAKKAPGQLEG